MAEPEIQTRLPENAYRELKPGETYVPMVPPNVTVPEVTTRSIVFGIVMNIVFAAAATYLALKVGQGIETAIPISILAVGLSGFLIRFGGRRSSLLENINILAIGTTSGIVAGGTVFTMPAIYILKLHEKLDMGTFELFLYIFLVPLLGAVLGVVFLIPFRRYFVKDMHGKLPFPEATATNEILVTGAGGAAGQAWILIYSFIVGGVYNWLSSAMKLFHEHFTTAAIPPLHKLTDNVKAVFSLGTGAEFLGLGFIIGIRYASIICAGSFLSWFVIIPLLGPLDLDQLQLLNATAQAHDGPVEAEPRLAIAADFGARFDQLEQEGLSEEELTARQDSLLEELRPLFASHNIALDPKTRLSVKESGSKWNIKTTDQTFVAEAQETEIAIRALLPGAEDIFGAIPRNIGIGGIFTAGLLSILKMGKVIVTALRQALGGLFTSKGTKGAHDRTDEDISYPTLLTIGLLTAVGIFLYFRFVALAHMPNPTTLTIISIVLALAIAFLFTTVSAWAIAMISVTPISGMTVTTIIITAVLMLWAGLPTETETDKAMSMLAVLLVGGVVCTALSMAGTLVTEFKLGYWAGASPKKICWAAIIAAVLASGLVTATIMVCAHEPGYIRADNPDALAAPQANVMASALDSFIGGSGVPWLMYGTGVVIVLLIELIGISGLAFALGMYLPMWLNTPILVGAIIALLVKRSAKDEKLSKARSDKGILIASGLIAGGAMIGVVKNGLTVFFKDFMETTINIGQWLVNAGWTEQGAGRFGNWFGLIAFVALCLWAYFDSRRAKPEKSE